MKTALLYSLGFLFAVQATAQSLGPNEGQSFSVENNPGSAQGWMNPDNTSASDNVYSWLTDTGNDDETYTDYLVISNFGFTIPSGASIYGIKIEIERSDPNQVTYDYSIRIVKNGILGSADRASGAPYPGTDEYAPYGSNSDLWGQTWSAADINHSKFGVAIAASRKGSGLAGRIDDVKITVYYSVITLPVKLLAFNAQRSGSHVNVTWITASETDMDQYIVERSADGRSFSAIENVQPVNQPQAEYSYNDMAPLNGVSFYRLAMKELSGAINYSRIVQVNLNAGFSAKIYPSPWSPGSSLFISNPAQDWLNIRFYNAEGKLLGTTHTGTNSLNMQHVKMQSGLAYFKVFNRMNELQGSGMILVK